MSYILDALKRADTERGTTAVSQPAPLLSTKRPTSATLSHLGIPAWMLLAVGAAVAAGTAWFFVGGASNPEHSTQAAPNVAAPAPALPSQPLGSPSPAKPTLPAAPPTGAAVPGLPTMETKPATGRSSAPFPQPPAPILAPMAPAAGSPAGEPPSNDQDAPVQENQPPAAKPGPVAPAFTTPAIKTPASSAPAPSGQGPVKVTGSTYSDNPDHRMLIVNGKVVREGQEVEPGLTLEVITPRSAVFNQNGARFNVNY